LKKAGIISLKIFDLMGREVATLVNGHKITGTHKAMWNGKDTFGNAMPSGMYLYRIEADGIVETRKMQLLK
jgi:flagellar hook assembly protein FlgD